MRVKRTARDAEMADGSLEVDGLAVDKLAISAKKIRYLER
jgi:hypothetical protein